jgi:hypothetical protein
MFLRIVTSPIWVSPHLYAQSGWHKKGPQKHSMRLREPFSPSEMQIAAA